MHYLIYTSEQPFEIGATIILMLLEKYCALEGTCHMAEVTTIVSIWAGLETQDLQSPANIALAHGDRMTPFPQSCNIHSCQHCRSKQKVAHLKRNCLANLAEQDWAP